MFTLEHFGLGMARQVKYKVGVIGGGQLFKEVLRRISRDHFTLYVKSHAQFDAPYERPHTHFIHDDDPLPDYVDASIVALTEDEWWEGCRLEYFEHMIPKSKPVLYMHDECQMYSLPSTPHVLNLCQGKLLNHPHLSVASVNTWGVLPTTDLPIKWNPGRISCLKQARIIQDLILNVSDNYELTYD
ncbi:MAG: hypothetical protein K0U52_06340 [Gammaproteobacteria bacterium]|nr:hypothetical protein [Gammaproteobacteria bacterium]